MVSDEGSPFVAEEHTDVDLNTAHEGGYGVFLIDSLMDSVQRHSPTNGNLGTDLVLIKGSISDTVSA
jgi:anti-sigma regulatory factor (Ser/Thr protein kinase)